MMLDAKRVIEKYKAQEDVTKQVFVCMDIRMHISEWKYTCIYIYLGGGDCDLEVQDVGVREKIGLCLYVYTYAYIRMDLYICIYVHL